MGLWGKSITTFGSRLAHRSSQERQVTESFGTKFTCGCKQKVWRDELVWDLANDLGQCYLVCNLMWHGRATAMQCFSKSDVMHMFMETRCICSCSMVHMMHVSMTRLPTKRVSD
jgi:hypothetical protein